jgi:hypothetical protein
MGIAFMAALLLIYGLIVWEFRDFAIAGLIMSPIPLTLIGIVPGHLVMGAEFTATSMIGMIALGGIIVRQSILIVEFVKIEVARGKPVREAAVDGAEIRMRPILITSLTLMAGAWAIIDDPIFQGMAVSLLFGAGVATLMAVIVIPLGCISLTRRFYLIETESGERMLADSYAEIEGGTGGADGGQGVSSSSAAPGFDEPAAATGRAGSESGSGLPIWMVVWSVLIAVISALINGVLVLVRLVQGLVARIPRRAESDTALRERAQSATGRGDAHQDDHAQAPAEPTTGAASVRSPRSQQPKPQQMDQTDQPLQEQQPQQADRPEQAAARTKAGPARTGTAKTPAKKRAAKKTAAKKTVAKKPTARKTTAKAAAKKTVAKKGVARKTTPKRAPAEAPSRSAGGSGQDQPAKN